MSRKKKGFTLVEIIVVIAISTIVLTMVGGSMIFITSTSADLMQQAEDIDMAKNIETYLRGRVDKLGDYKTALVTVGDEEYVLLQDGNLIAGNKIIFSDTGLDSFNIQEGVCSLEFKSGKKFIFTLWIEETRQGE